MFSFFQDGLKAVESLRPSVEKLSTDLTTVRTRDQDGHHSEEPSLSVCVCVPQIKQSQDGERKQLNQLRDVLKASLQAESKEVGNTTTTPRVHLSKKRPISDCV